MKITRLTLFIILLLVSALALFACGGGDNCTEHTDGDGDGKCDKCGEAALPEEAKLMLFDNGMPTFQIVYEAGLAKSVKDVINSFVFDMEKIEVEIDSVIDKESNIKDIEILVGDVKSRGEEYRCNKYDLGKEGYIFKLVGTRIVINGGSAEALVEALEAFIGNILGYKDGVRDMGTVYMTESKQVHIIPEYNITSFKINGKDINGYTIATYTDNEVYLAAAQELQALIYERVGIWLEIVPRYQATNSIIMRPTTEKISGEESFKVSVNGKDQLIIECAYENKLNDALASFTTKHIFLAKGDVDFKGTVFTQDISFLTYEAFGAVGDGKTDDFEAIYKTHTEANKGGQTVKAKRGAKYYIRDNRIKINSNLEVVTIPIKTNVDWTGAEFIIDDSDLDMHDSKDKKRGGAHIFNVLSDYSSVKITDRNLLDKIVADGLGRSSTKVDLGLDYPALIIPYDSTHKVFRRFGYTSFPADSMHEIIVIDENGNIDLTSDSKTPLMFDYTSLDYIMAYRIDDVHLTIKGGTVTHIGHRIDAVYDEINPTTGAKVTRKAGYIARGLGITRSFTTVNGLVHNIKNEITPKEYVEQGLQSCPYNGFFTASYATNVTFKNCTLTGRRYYNVEGTYDFSANCVNKIVLDGCVQQNFWVTYDEDIDRLLPSTRGADGALPSMSVIYIDSTSVRLHWGIGGTNFCKNMEYIDSTLSRFDAHAGLYNGKITDSTICSMELIGTGDFIMENVDWYAKGVNDVIFQLRSDYGATWDGTLYAKDLRAYIYPSGSVSLIYHYYQNWFWGYNVVVPNLALDNFKLYDITNYQPIETAKEINLMSSTFDSEPAIHLSYTQRTQAKYPYLDKNNDGFIDDLPTVPYDSSLLSSYKNGYPNDGDMQNLARVKPPEYIKIINTNENYRFIVADTYGDAPSADPEVELPPDVSDMGGFFGTTKFYYGIGENDYYRGTNHEDTRIYTFR